MTGLQKLHLAGASMIGLPRARLEFPGTTGFLETTDELGHYRIDGFPLTKTRPGSSSRFPQDYRI